MRHPDPLIMSADIARVASERPELDEELIQAIYQHLVLIERRQPTIDELREYVDRVSSLAQDKLRQRLGLGRRKRGPRGPAMARRPSPTRTTSAVAEGMTFDAGIHEESGHGRVQAEEADAGPADRRSVARGPGRPGWTSELFSTRYQAALDRATPPYTHQSIADQFEMLDGSVGPDPDHLRKLLKRYGRPPG